MFCPNCGKETPDSTKLCDGCGSDLAGGPAQATLQHFQSAKPEQYSLEHQQMLQRQYARAQLSQAEAQSGGINVGRALSHIFKDKGWFGILAVGALFMLIPILDLFILLGYGADRMRAVAYGQELPLPGFAFKKNLMQGFSVFGKILFADLIILTIFMVPVGISVFLPVSIAAIVSQLLIFITTLLSAIYLWISMTFAICEDSFAIFTSFGRVIRIAKSNIGMLLKILVSLLLAILINNLGIAAFGIGLLFTLLFVYGFFMPHILGQFYAKAKNK